MQCFQLRAQGSLYLGVGRGHCLFNDKYVGQVNQPYMILLRGREASHLTIRPLCRQTRKVTAQTLTITPLCRQTLEVTAQSLTISPLCRQTRVVTETACLPLSWTLDLQPALPPLLPPVPLRPHWTLSGGQPVTEFSRFCARLERASVALETAVCGAGQRTIAGVIRVKNLGFEKRVFLRSTSDNWRSSRDWSAVYIAPIAGAVGPPPPYDRFSFEFETPEAGSDAEKIEFCVCFQCAAGEFWDNNGGGNYVAVREKSPERAPEPEVEKSELRPPPRDVFRAKVSSSWAYFSSWESVTAEVPYW